MTSLVLSLMLAAGCDAQSLAGRACGADALGDSVAQSLARSVGGVNVLRERAAKVKATWVTQVFFNGTKGVDITFDEHGRITQVDSGSLFKLSWSDDHRLLETKRTALGKTTTELFEGDATHCTVRSTTDSSPTITRSCEAVGKTITRSERFSDEKPLVTKVTLDDAAAGIDWELDGFGLPVRSVTKGTEPETFRWTRPTVVRIVDGTCDAKKKCERADVDALAKSLADKDTVTEVGVPTPRASTEVWFQGSAQQRATELSKRVNAAPPRAWTGGGAFDVLIILKR